MIRESGTEPLIRVMAEGEDEALVGRMVDELCETIAAGHAHERECRLTVRLHPSAGPQTTRSRWRSVLHTVTTLQYGA